MGLVEGKGADRAVKRKMVNLGLLIVAAVTLTLLIRSARQRPLIEISREAWEYYHTTLYAGYSDQVRVQEWNWGLLNDDMRYARQAGDLAWLDQLKRLGSAISCQIPQYNWYPACNIKLTDEPRIQGSIPLLSREEALTPDVQKALEEIIFRFASLRYNHNPEGMLTIESAYFIDSELGNSAQLLAWIRLDNGERANPETFFLVIHNLHQASNRWVYWNDYFGYLSDITQRELPPNDNWPEYHAVTLPLIEGASMRFDEMEWMLGQL